MFVGRHWRNLLPVESPSPKHCLPLVQPPGSLTSAVTTSEPQQCCKRLWQPTVLQQPPTGLAFDPCFDQSSHWYSSKGYFPILISQFLPYLIRFCGWFFFPLQHQVALWPPATCDQFLIFDDQCLGCFNPLIYQAAITKEKKNSSYLQWLPKNNASIILSPTIPQALWSFSENLFKLIMWMGDVNQLKTNWQ